MKPIIHCQSSAKQFGGKPEDYLPIHDWFDQTKAHFPDNRHRALLHSSFGIFLAEQVFGSVFENSEGKIVSIRDIGEQHVLEDLGFIPTVADYLDNLEYQPWMGRENGAEKPRKSKIPKVEKVPKVNPAPSVVVPVENPYEDIHKRPYYPWSNPQIID